MNHDNGIAAPMLVAVFGANSAMAVAWLRAMPYAKAKVLLFSRDAEALRALADDLRVRKGYETLILAGDLADAAFQAECLREIGRQGPRLDHALVAYGALGDQGDLFADRPAALDLIHLNYNSKVGLILGLFAGGFIGSGGSLTVISSVAGERGRPSNFIYGSAFAGLTAFSEGLAAAASKQGVFVQVIKPGFVDSPMTARVRKNALFVKPDHVARDIWQAHGRRAEVIFTPWFWRWIMLIIRCIPMRLFKKLSI